MNKDLQKQINNRDIFAPEQKKYTVYIPKYGLTVKTGLTDARGIMFATETSILRQKKEDYFALGRLGESKKDFSNGVFNQAFRALGGVAVNTAGNLYGFARNMPKKVWNMARLHTARETAQELRNGLPLEDYKKFVEEESEIYDKAEALREAWSLRQRKSLEDFMAQSGMAKENQDGFTYDLFSGVGSAGAALGLMAVTKSPASVTALFSAASAQDYYTEALNNGVRGNKALGVGLSAGVLEGALEAWAAGGLYRILRGEKLLKSAIRPCLKSAKKIGAEAIMKAALKGNGLPGIVKAAAQGAVTEGIEEFAQNVSTSAILNAAGVRDNKWYEVIIDAFYSAAIGAFVGGGMGAVGRSAVLVAEDMQKSRIKRQAAEYMARTAENLENVGMPKEAAAQVAREVIAKANSPEIMAEMIKLAESENSPLAYENGDTAKVAIKFGEQFKEWQDPKKRAAAAKDIWDIRDKVLEVASKAGLNGPEAEFVARMYQSAANMYYANTGVMPKEWFEENKLEIENEAKNYLGKKAGNDTFYHAAAMYKSRAKNLAEFKNVAQKNKKNKEKANKEFYTIFGEKEIDVPAERIVSPLINLSADELDDLEKVFKKPVISAFRILEKSGHYKGVKIELTTNLNETPISILLEQVKKDNGYRIFLSEVKKYPAATLAQESAVFNGQDNYTLTEVLNIVKKYEDERKPSLTEKQIKEAKDKITYLKKHLQEEINQKYDKNNFFQNTKANFTTAKEPERKPDFISDSGSAYWYEKEGVYRKSEHWGSGIATCDWYLDSKEEEAWIDKSDNRVGYAKWSDFQFNGEGEIKNKISALESEIKKYDTVNNFEQSAYHGSPHRFDKFSTEAIGTGEGAQAHGWGLYFSQDKEISENYRQSLSRRYRNFEIDGKPASEEISRVLHRNLSFEAEYSLEKGDKSLATEEIETRKKHLKEDVEQKRKSLALLQEFSEKISNLKETYELYEVIKSFPKEKENELRERLGGWNRTPPPDYARTLISSQLKTTQGFLGHIQKTLDILENLDIDKLAVSSKKGQLFEVEIPDNDVLLDEQLPLNKQPEKVREAILKYYQSRPDSYNAPKDKDSLDNMSGENFYREVKWQMQREGKSNPKKEASLLLNDLGIKGITYEGRQDGRCFVVFDDKAVEVIETFYQGEKSDIEEPRARVSFTPQGVFMQLLENADPSSIVHETAGHVLLRNIENIKGLAELKGTATPEFMQVWTDLEAWLGKAELTEDENGKPVYRFSREQQEMFAEGMEKMFAAGKAPTKMLEKVFAYFKNMLRDMFEEAREFLNLRPEVENLFERILALEEIEKADSKVYKGKAKDIKEIAQKAREGKAATINGLGIKEVKTLLKQLNRRRPGEPKEDLLKTLKRTGADFDNSNIVDTEVYQNAGIRNDKNGVGDKLADYLAAHGYMTEAEGNLSYEEVSKREEEAADLIQRALAEEKIYRLEDLDRVEAIENFDENIRSIREVFGNNIKQAEETLRSIEALQDKGYRIVGNSDIEFAEGESEKLLTFADREKELKAEIEKLTKEKDGLKERLENKTIEAHKRAGQALEREELLKKESEVKEALGKARRDEADNLKKAKRIKNALVNEIEKRELEGKEELLKGLKEAKSAEDIFNAAFKLTALLEKAFEKTESGIMAYKLTQAPKTDWQGKKIGLIKKFAEITAKADEKTKEAMELIKKGLRAKRGEISLSQEEKLKVEKAKDFLKKNIETKYIKAFEESLRGEPHIQSADINKMLKFFASEAARLDMIKDRQIDGFLQRAELLQKSNYHKYIGGKINKILTSKLYEAGAVRKAKYTPEVLAFINQARENWTLSKNEAKEKFDGLQQVYNPENPPSAIEALANNILEFRALGADMRAGEMQGLYEDIQALLKADKLEKNFEKMRIAIAEESMKLKLALALKDRKLNKADIQYILRGGIDYQTLLNMLFGEYEYEVPLDGEEIKLAQAKGREMLTKKEKINFRELLAPELQQMAQQTFKLKGDEAINELVAQAYGLKTSAQVLSKIQQMQSLDIDLINYGFMKDEGQGDMVVSVLKNGKLLTSNNPRMQKASKLNIIAFWIWAQNHEYIETKDGGSKDVGLAGRLERAYGREQLNEVFNLLDKNDIELAKSLMKLAQKNYEAENIVHRRIYGFSLPTVENYFPSVADRIGGTDYDFAAEFAANGKSPSFIKQRVKSDRVIQKLVNPLGVLKNHLRRAGEFIFCAEKYTQLLRLFKNSEIQSAFIEKFGQEDGLQLYQKLLDLTAQQGPKKYKTKGDAYQLLDWVFNNTVKSVMGLKVITGIKQFASSISFAEKMPAGLWLKYFTEGLLNPKRTAEFMRVNVDYINTRYESAGVNEAMARAAASESEINSFAEKYNNFTNLAMLNLRLGDAGSFIYGGYPYMKYLTEIKGLSLKEAAAEVAKQGARTLQSPLAVHLSQTQADADNLPIRTITLFRNQQMQYIRRIWDSYVEMKNGAISKKQFAKTAFLYAFLNPIIYELLGLAWLLPGEDEEEKEKALINLALSPLSNTAGAYFMGDSVVDFLTDNIVNLAYGDKIKAPYGNESFFIDTLSKDIYKAVKLVNAEDISAEEFIDCFNQAGKYLGLPLPTVKSIGKGAWDIFSGKFAKGGLEMLGYTENRAKKAVGE